jgi:UDP-glucose 4-epimerase
VSESVSQPLKYYANNMGNTQQLIAVSSFDFPFNHAPRLGGDSPTLIADLSKLHVQLCWRPRFADLAVIVADAWRRQCCLQEVRGT